MKKKKVLIIGAGDRVRNTILPALWCLREQFEIIGIINRSSRALPFGNLKQAIKTQTTYEHIDFQALDLIIVAISLDQVPNVLKEVNSRFQSDKISFLLDTPVLSYFHLAFLKTILRMRSVSASEETAFQPDLKLAKELIVNNKVGSIRQIYLLNYGYKYHALAAIKFLTGSKIVKITSHSDSPLHFQKEITLSNGVKVFHLEPQDYLSGRFLIVGEQGIISNFKLNAGNCFNVEVKQNARGSFGMQVNGISQKLGSLDKLFIKSIKQVRFEQNVTKSLKVRAFMELLWKNRNDKSSTYKYTPLDSFSDQIAVGIAEKFGTFIDYQIRNTTIFSQILKIISLLLPQSVPLPKFKLKNEG